MKVQEAFGQILREIRTQVGISQEKLAHASELDRTFISLLERGQRQPSLSTIFQLSKALGVAPDHLIRCTEIKTHEG
jgi:transcriptional regulator with XRE-family HTH domain